MQFNIIKDREVIFSLVCIVAIIILLMLPTGFEKQIYTNAEHVKVRVLETNESGVYNSGLLKLGSQECIIEVLEGTFKGLSPHDTRINHWDDHGCYYFIISSWLYRESLLRHIRYGSGVSYYLYDGYRIWKSI